MDQALLSPKFQSLEAALRQAERDALLHAIFCANGEKAEIAEQLGISRRSLNRLLKRHGFAEHDSIEAGAKA